MTQHDDPPLPLRERGEGEHEGVSVVGVRLGRTRVDQVDTVEPGPLATPGAPPVVEMGVDDDAPDEGVDVAGAVHPWPGDVQLRQGGLHEVLGAVDVPAQQVRRAAQLCSACRDVLAVPLVASASARSHPVSSPP